VISLLIGSGVVAVADASTSSTSSTPAEGLPAGPLAHISAHPSSESVVSPISAGGSGNKTGTKPLTVEGNCTNPSGCADEVAIASSAQSTFTGAITSETGYQYEATWTATTTTSNDYALVLTALPATGGSNCNAYACSEQFIYFYNAGTAKLEIEQFYLADSSCFTPFTYVSGQGCVDTQTSSALSSSYDVSPGSLSGISLQGYSSSTADWVQVCYNSSCYKYSVSDYILMYQVWEQTLFNIAGDPHQSGSNPIAVFNGGTAVGLTDTAGSGSVSYTTTDAINEAVDFTIASQSSSGSTLTYTENNLPTIYSISTAGNSCQPSGCATYGMYCTAATSCSVTGTFATGALVILAYQLPSGTITAGDTIIDGSCSGYIICETMVASWSTINGEAVGLSYGYGTLLGGSSDTFTVSTTGSAGTIGIEVLEVLNGVAFFGGTPSAWQSYSGTSSGCATSTSICINSGLTPTDAVNLDFASIYAAPGYNGVSAGTYYSGSCATSNSARCVIYADDLSTSSATQFPATDAVSASYWGDGGWTWDL
jgi:hypothetical protein